MPRLFVAAWPPAEVLALVAALPRPAVTGLRWTTPDQWHVTLRFLGSVADAAPVVAALQVMTPAITSDVEAGPTTGRFGHRILHLPVRGLEGLAGAVTAATAGLGQPPDDRPFTGHLTLGRVSNAATVDLRPLVGAPLAARWTVTEVTLVESRLSSSGARYEIVARFPLVP